MVAEPHSGHLLTASQSGDREALDALLARHQSHLRAFVRLRMSPLLRAHESCSDLVQSACREVLIGLEEFEYRGEEAFRAFLFTAVLNKLRNKERDLRAQKRDARREVAIDSGAGPGTSQIAQLYATVLSPTQTLMAEERVRALETAFDELPEHYREVVTLARIAGMSRAQIAQHTGRSEASVRNLLSRALIALAHRLDRAGADSSG